MAQDATLHVKLDSDMAGKLKKLAYDQGKSKGQLVREAISACYQTELDDLPLRQRQAVAAYQGGYISIGKLARVMGMHALELRGWLKEHGIAARNAFDEADVQSA
jgi:predicted HTH domain antitoxin